MDGIKIGFEIHVQLNTKQKLFCTCPTHYSDAEPNTLICPICTGHPGTKPMPPNYSALKNLIKVGLILGCKPVEKKIFFLRKHYFYPDLPKNYQITSEPIMVDGLFFGVRIREIHLEEDPGNYDLRNGYVNYNRSGIPLAEIVTEPDITSAKQAKDWLKRLFLYLKHSKAVREDPGSIRVDLNISIPGGNRVEVKNINSIENVYRAINFEILRQSRSLKMGKEIKRETRHFDEEKKITIPLREKETVADYRYIPDPDLLPFKVEKDLIDAIRKEVINLKEIEDILRNKYQLSGDFVSKLMSDPPLLERFMDVVKYVRNPTILAEIFTTYKDYLPSDIKNNVEKINELCILIEEEKILRRDIPSILSNIVSIKSVEDFARSRNLLVCEIKEEHLITTIKEVLSKETKAVNDYKSGRKEALNYLVGKVLQSLDGKANPKVVREKILKLLFE